MRRRKRVLLLVGAAMALLGACGGDDSSSSESTDVDDTSSSEDTGTLSVYAMEAVEPILLEIADAFEAENPGVPVEVTTQDTQPMVETVADRSADIAILPDAWLTDGPGDVETGPFGRNTAVIVVPTGNPNDITELDAFAADSGFQVQTCGDQTALGRFILLLLTSAGVTPDPGAVDSGCESSAAAQVASGDLDAALMYRFGLQVPEGAEVIEVDPADNREIVVSYFVLSDSTEAAEFATFLESDAVNTILVESGYLP